MNNCINCTEQAVGLFQGANTAEKVYISYCDLCVV